MILGRKLQEEDIGFLYYFGNMAMDTRNKAVAIFKDDKNAKVLVSAFEEIDADGPADADVHRLRDLAARVSPSTSHAPIESSILTSGGTRGWRTKPMGGSSASARRRGRISFVCCSRTPWMRASGPCRKQKQRNALPSWRMGGP